MTEISSNLNELNLNKEYNSNCLYKSQLLAALFMAINHLFENKEINLEQKLSLKQLLISDSENVINRFNEFKKSKFAFEKSKELDILVNLNPKTEDELDEMVGQIEPKLKIFAIKGNKKRITNTDKFYYDKKTNEKNENK